MKDVKKIKDYEALVNSGLSGYTDDEFLEHFKKIERIIIDFWLTGFLPELSNWGGERILKDKILDFNKSDFIEIFEKLCAPEEFSFYQVEEKEFLKIRLLKDKQEINRRLEEHQENYYWMQNSYGFTKKLSVEHFRKELEKISIEEAERKLKEINNYKSDVAEKKSGVIEKYNISEEVVWIAKKLSYYVWWQDYRKQ